MKYYLIKGTPGMKDILEFSKIDKCKSCVELSKEELEAIANEKKYLTSSVDYIKGTTK